MSATSPRSLRLRRRLAIVESLEARALLAAQPTAVADTYTVVQGQILSVSFPRNEFHTDADNYHPPGPRTWTQADGPIYATSVRTGSIRIHGGAPGGVPYWDLEFFNLSFDQPLAPGYYAANTQATAPGVQTILGLHESGVGGTGSPNPAHFIIYDLDVTHGINGDTVNRFDADFVIDGIAAGSVHYSSGPRGLLDNDSGPADTMTASLVAGPAHGSLSLNPDGTFIYTPDPGFVGIDSFTYAATDGTTTSAPAAVSLNIIPVNQPPSFTKGSDITLVEHAGPQSIANWATDISPGPGASDADQSVSFVVYVSSGPTLFSQAPSIDPTGRLTFTPAPEATGTATVTVLLRDSGGTANDGQDTSVAQTFTVNVTPVNDAPVAQNSSVSTTAGQPVSGQVSFLDFDGPSISVQVVTPPAHGSVTVERFGAFTYTPAAGFSGADSFQFAVSDGLLTSNTATVALNVLPTTTSDPGSGGTGGNTGGDSSFLYFGFVMDVYDQPNGMTLTSVAGRTVFDDANDNGQLDPGEATAVTDIMGRYDLTLPIRVHTIRLLPKAGWVTPDGYASAVVTDVAYGPRDNLYTTMANPVVIDVLAVHPAPVSILDMMLPWDDAIRDAFAAANAIFANSDTNVRLTLVGVEPVKYTPANNLQLDLARLYKIGDGALDTVPKRRDALKADLAILFTARGDGQRSGVAYVLDAAHPDASRGYAVVAASSDATLGGKVLAHEIGHTLGADHDPDNGPRNFVRYAHGYRFTGNDNVLYHDVMAYDPGQMLPFFSSPLLSYAGHTLGDAGTADNARVVRENAYAVASYRGPAIYAPGAVTAVAATVSKASAKPGDALTAKATLRNNSASKFSGKVAVAFYLSKDKTLDASDTLLKRTYVTAKNLAAKGALATSAALKIDAKWSAGTYYVLAVATTTGTPADERTAKSMAAPLKVATPPKKPGTKAKPIPAPFHTTRPIAGSAPARDPQSDDRDTTITQMLHSPR